MSIPTLRKQVARLSLPVVTTGFGLGAIAILLLWRLSSLVVGGDTAELGTRAASLSGRAMLDNPINAPFTAIAHGLLKLAPNNLLSLRLVSVLFGAITIGLFFCIVRAWYTTRLALLASALFATSTWTLYTSRHGTPDVLLFVLLILCAGGVWLQQTRHSRLVIVLAAIIAATSLYIPGMVWFIVTTGVWQRKVIRQTLGQTPWWLLLLIGLMKLLLLAPLGLALAKHPSLLWDMLGLPTQLPIVPTVLHRLTEIPLNLFIYGPNLPGFWVGHTPILNVLETALFVFGTYSYLRHWRLTRVISMFSIFGIGAVLISLGGPVSLTLLLPFVYLVIAAGLAYLLRDWLSVFPRNPFARNFGLILVTLAVIASCAYHLNRYFIVWPHLAATKQAFDKHL